MGMPRVLQAGTAAPKFSLPDRTGELCTLADLKGDYTVLFFYPKDSTPGCTIEAREFNQALKKFQKRKIAVIGISGGDQKSKEKFCSKQGLKLPMLSDSDFKTAAAYGVFGQKKFMGRTFNGIHRATYVLDKQLKVLKVFDKVSPAGHADEILDYISSLK